MSDEQFSGPWLPWYHGDFLRATQGWTVTERGVYFLLLGASWEVGPLPEDRRRLAGIVGAQLDEFDEAWKTVSIKFQKTKRGLINRRLELHREKQAGRSEKARQSAMNRWAKPGDQNANGHANGHANADANADAGDDAQGHANSMLKGMRTRCSADAPEISNLRSQNADFKSQNGERGHRAARNAPSRIPDDFALTAERRAYAVDRGLDADRTFELFCTYWHQATRNASKHDWEATWRHWVTKDAAKLAERDRPRKTRVQAAQERLDARLAERNDAPDDKSAEIKW
jgi:uncharacterized protein YdaU (DUF1376 family)